MVIFTSKQLQRNHEEFAIAVHMSGVSMGIPQHWMVYFMDNPIEMDDLGVPPLYESSTWILYYVNLICQPSAKDVRIPTHNFPLSCWLQNSLCEYRKTM